MIKKIAIFLLAFLFVYSYLLYFGVFYNQLSNIKQQIEQIQKTSGYVDDHTVTLSFKKGLDGFVEAKLTWLEADEFIWKDNLYDILSIKETGGSISFYCRLDEEEKMLRTQLEDYINGAVQSEKSGGKTLFKFSVLIRDFICLPLASPVSDFDKEQQHQSHLSFHYSSRDLTIESPPPSGIFFSFPLLPNSL